jgi:hypothetical protein
LHGFFTITTALMLIWYLRFEKGWSLSILADGLNTLRNQGKDLGRQFGSLTQEHTWRTSTCDCRESDIAIEKHIPDYVTSCIWRLSLGLSRVLHRNAPVFREVYRGNGCFCRQSARTVW